MKKNSVNNDKKVYISTLLLMILLMTLFLNSFYWPYTEISKRKILVGMIVCFCVIVVPILFVKIKKLNDSACGVIDEIKNKINEIKTNKKTILSFVFVGLIGIVLAYLVAYIGSRFVLRTAFNSRLLYAIFTVEAIGLFMICMRERAARRPEKIFAVTALILGVFCISITPSRVGVSWDDEIHYARTLELSNFLNGIMYEADEKNIEDYANNIYGRVGYDRITEQKYMEELESSYEVNEWNSYEFSDYGVWSIAYIPSAIGIILGRGLGLSYTGVFNMGRFLNLLMYVLLIYMAIKKVKYGKVLIATIGLIPTSIFMASSYSYDPWVTGFTILGFSYFVAELQDDEPLKNKNIVMMVGAIAIGCIPKATYFPLLFPLLFMPKKKFKDSKQRKYYYLAVIAMAIFLLSTFLLPMLIGGAGTGDARGGADVNATNQIMFILQNPLAYIKILFKFLRNYISLGFAGPMLQKFAYVGDGYYYSSVCLILILVAFLDRGEREKSYNSTRVAGLIGCAATIILSTTALYVSFTAVAAETVAGMQGRYIIPTIFPALYSIGNGGVTHKINKNVFVCAPMVLIAITLILNMVQYCVIPY